MPSGPGLSPLGSRPTLLDSPEIVSLIAELEALRWTGRKGYSVRSLVGACLVKSLYAIPTWTRVAGLIAEHGALREALGDAPSVSALYRFATKLRAHNYRGRAAVERAFGRLKTKAVWHRSACAGLTASSFALTSASSPRSRRPSPEREPYHSRRSRATLRAWLAPSPNDSIIRTTAPSTAIRDAGAEERRSAAP